MRKTCHARNFYTTNPAWTDLRANTRFHGEKLATDCIFCL